MQNEGLTIGQPLFKLDPILGVEPAPNATGAFLIPLGEPVPFHNDSEGLRAPLGVKHSFDPSKHPRLMFFGDSFTYGEMVSAENAFAYRSAAILGGESINAGVPGYNLAQMLLRAQRLVPKYQPDYLVVQYSPWLVTRAEHISVQNSNGYLMAPFFYHQQETAQVSPVLFTPPDWTLQKTEKFKYSKPGTADRVSFFFEFGAPFLVHHDLNMAALRIKQLLGLAPTPTKNSSAIVRYAFQQFDTLAKQNHGQLIILVLGYAWPIQVPYDLFPENAVIVNGWAKLVGRLDPMLPQNYINHYFLHRGNPPTPVDGHPNEKADAIVADAIADTIRDLEQQTAANQTQVSNDHALQ